jgi:sugar phosphate isomerase/epimerase
MEALAEIGYDGDLTLEADNFMAHVPMIAAVRDPLSA